MFLFMLIAFLVVPIIEIYVLAQVADSIGWFNGIALMIVISVVGAWLVRSQGFEILRRLQHRIGQGQMPNVELVDGGLVLFAGALLLTPGFVTDTVGFLCLLPPTRALIRPPFVKRLQASMDRGRTTFMGGFGGPGRGFGRGDVYDTTVVDHEPQGGPDDEPDDTDPIELGP